ncbi:hypothetical protein [Paucihalobacter sp.]|uniref:hypothetical protein n=1 Tax=Paucihalobacter sp. TaxID=2850405 RepID=UPI002FE1C26C
MTPTNYYPKLMKWLSADDLNSINKNWLSELQFIKDEQRFFNQLLVDNSAQMTAASNYSKSKELLEKLAKSATKTLHLITIVEKHLKDLIILVDGKDQLEAENDFKRVQTKLDDDITDHVVQYKALKKELFKHTMKVCKSNKTDENTILN